MLEMYRIYYKTRIKELCEYVMNLLTITNLGKMNSKMSYMRITRPGNFEGQQIPILQDCLDRYTDDKNRGTLSLLDKKRR